jgi:hypothetical protein
MECSVEKLHYLYEKVVSTMCPFYVKQRLCSTEILFPRYDLFQGDGSGGFMLDRTGSG